MAFQKFKADTPQSLLALWEKGTFHPVYLFAGPDTLQKEEAAALFQKKFLAGDDSGLNVDRLDGQSASAGEILNAFLTMGFLGGKRLVLVRRAQELAAAEALRLADGLAAAPAGNALLLFWEDKLDNRSVLVQAVKSKGMAVSFWPPFENQLPGWAQERARAAGKELAPEAARALVDLAGGQLPDLAQEIDKLVLYAGGRKVITEADVEALAPEGRALAFLEFDRAVWRGDAAEVLRLLESRRAAGEPPEAVLAALARIYRRLFLAKTLLAEKKASREDVLRDVVKTKMRRPQEEFLEAVSAASWTRLLNALEKILDAETDLKTGRLDPDTGLTLLLRDLT
jgi:DNA polymerase III subunit delta